MPIVLACLLFAAGLGTLAWQLSRPGGYLTVPAIVGALYLGWVGPQYLVLARTSGPYDGNVTALGIMALVCFGAALLGWYLGVGGPRELRHRERHFPVERLVLPVAALSVFAAFMDYLVWSQPEQAVTAGQWSGEITIYAFFASLRTLALTLSLLMLLKKRSIATIALVALNLAVTLPVAFVMLRRTEIAEVGIAILGALWFVRRVTLPTVTLIAAAIGLMAIVYAIVPLRNASQLVYEQTGERPWIFDREVLRRIDFEASIESGIEDAPDMRNAAQLIAYVDAQDRYAWGSLTWNGMVRQWVPGQIVGRDLKQSLMIGPRDSFAQIEATSGFNYRTGTTSTGFGSAYSDFGFFGCLYFLLFGAVAGFFYNRAMQGGVWGQTLYLATATLILTAFTHGHTNFFSQLPLSLLAVAGVASVARHVTLGRIAGRPGPAAPRQPDAGPSTAEK